MDMAFINAINQSGTFPPHDPWMSGESLNYYYFGHVVLRVADQAARPGARTPATCSAGALLMGLTATAVYAFAGTLWAAASRGARRPRAARRAGRRGRWSPRRW